MRKIIIGVIGPGENATKTDLHNAYELGNLIAMEGWVLLTGGRKIGVMDAANKGAKAAKGLTIGILPNREPESVSDAVDLAIFTDMGSARNNINVLSSKVIIACGVGLGTISEIALALKAHRQVILLNNSPDLNHVFESLSKEKVLIVNSPLEAVESIKKGLLHLE